MEGKIVSTNIIINTQFVALHNWPGCDVRGMEYLRDTHRHIFSVKVKVPVNHDDRDIEFINFKKEMDAWFLANYQNKDLGAKSCEMICNEIMAKWDNIVYVCVLEDFENGAEKEILTER